MLNVPRHAFWPQPKVDSCVVRLVPKPPPFKVKDRQVFFDVTRAIFSHRRKKISNSLKVDPAVASLVTSEVESSLDKLPYASKRAEELSPEMIGELADALLDLSASSPGNSAR
jgi:16S rRNA (adenine1518-N6/adenine1519-N6)-dimethyltransferase